MLNCSIRLFCSSMQLCAKAIVVVTLASIRGYFSNGCDHDNLAKIGKAGNSARPFTPLLVLCRVHRPFSLAQPPTSDAHAVSSGDACELSVLVCATTSCASHSYRQSHSHTHTRTCEMRPFRHLRRGGLVAVAARFAGQRKSTASGRRCLGWSSRPSGRATPRIPGRKQTGQRRANTRSC